MGKIDMLQSASHIAGPGLPLNWHALLRYLLSKKILKTDHLEFNPCRNDLPKAYYGMLSGQFEPRLTDSVNVAIMAQSHSSSPEAAVSKVIGELLERYFLTLYKRSSLICSSYVDLSRK